MDMVHSYGAPTDSGRSNDARGRPPRRNDEARRLLFFAVLPDRGAKQSIAPLIASSRDRWGLSGPWRPEHVWHATLQGIGPDEPLFRDLALHVGDKIAMEAFDVSFDRVMSFRGS